MKKTQKFPISSLLAGRSRLIEIIISTLFIGFGISLTASSISLVDKFNPLIGIYLGLFICGTSTIFIAYRIFGRKDASYTYEAFIIIKEKENRILGIEGYNFAESLSDYFRTAFSENKALEHIWNTEPLRLQDELKKPEPHSVNLIRESIEYYLLDILSTHLSGFFCYPAKKEKNVAVFQRDNIPTILLKNRFLELFSRPMEERKSFIGTDEIIKEDEEPYIFEVDGAIYRKFEMVLPYKSKIERVNNGISIKTKRFTLSFKIHFDGTNTVVPHGFMEYYLSIKGFNESLANVVYNVSVEVSVNFKAFSAFSPSGWDDYNWIDSFLDKLEESLSKKNFFERINWNTIYPIVKYLDMKKESKKQIKESSAQSSLASQKGR